MREIGSVADDLDIGATIEGIVIHMAALWDAYFGEAGAIKESSFDIKIHISPMNLRHRRGYDDACEVGAIRESIFPNLRH